MRILRTSSKPDSVTITARGFLGHAEYRDEPFFPIVRLLVLEPKGKLDPRFTTYAINDRVEFALESTGVPQLTAPQVGKYSVAAPSTLTEQRAIAEALGDVDALLGGLDRLIAKQRDLKQAAVQQLLTGQTRLPGFSGKWAPKEMDALAAVDPENLASNTSPDYRFNYISLEQVDAGRLLGVSQEVFRTAPSRARRILRCNDVLMSTVRPNLKAHLHYQSQVDNAVCSTGFAVLRARSGISSAGYLFAHLFGQPVNQQIEKILAGSNYPAINSGEVRKLEIPCPPSIDEQTAIATVLSDMDTELAALKSRRAKTRDLKQAMMQELLTGKIRLLKPEVAHA